MKGLKVFLLLVMAVLAVSTARADDYSAWPFRMYFVVPNATLDDTQPTSETSGIYSFTFDSSSLITRNRMKSDCSDIRVSDLSGNPLQFSVRRCNTSSTILLVRVPQVPANQSYQVVMHHGNLEAVNAAVPDILGANWRRCTGVHRDSYMDYYNNPFLIDSCPPVGELNDSLVSEGICGLVSENKRCVFGVRVSLDAGSYSYNFNFKNHSTDGRILIFDEDRTILVDRSFSSGSSVDVAVSFELAASKNVTIIVVRNSSSAGATATATPLFGTRMAKAGVLPPNVDLSCPVTALPTKQITCTARLNLIRDPASGNPFSDLRNGWQLNGGSLVNLTGGNFSSSTNLLSFTKEFLIVPGTYQIMTRMSTGSYNNGQTVNVIDPATNSVLSSATGNCSYSSSSYYCYTKFTVPATSDYARVKISINFGESSTYSNASVYSFSLIDFSPKIQGKWLVQGGSPATTSFAAPSGVTNTTFEITRSVTFTSAGANTVTLKIWDSETLGESYALQTIANVFVPNPVTSVQVTCPEEALVGETVTCQLQSEKDSSLTYSYSWDVGSDGTIVQNLSTSIRVKWSTNGVKRVAARVSVVGAPSVFLEDSTNVNTVFDVRVTGFNCPDQVKMGEMGSCSVSVYCPFGSVRYEWIPEDGNAVFTTPTASTTSFYMTRPGPQVIQLRLSVPEVQGVTKTLSKTIEVSPMDISLEMTCPPQVEKGQVFQCSAAGSAEFGTLEYLWSMGENGTPTSGLNGTVFYGRFNATGMSTVGVRMCLRERNAICLERVAQVEVIIAPPTVQSASCSKTDIILGQEVLCSIRAESPSGTVGYLWTTDGNGDAIEKPELAQTKVQLRSAGQRRITVRAYIKEYQSSFVEVPIDVNVAENRLDINLACPESVVSKREFSCTLDASALWGTVTVKWSGSNITLKSGGMNPVFVPTTTGAGVGTVVAEVSLAEAPWYGRRLERQIRVINSDEVTPVITGEKAVYVGIEYTYQAKAPCLDRGACTIKWEVNGSEINGTTARVKFQEEGKYVLRAISTFTETGNSVSSEMTVYANKLPRPLVSIEGPSAVFADDPVTFRAVVSKNHESLPVVGRWIMPDGTIVEGFEVEFSPSSGTGRYTLVFEAWIDGYRDSTLRVVEKKVNAAIYEFPVPRIVARVTEGVAPAAISFKTEFTKKRVSGARYRITYHWDFGDGETMTTENYFVTHEFGRAGSYLVRMTAVDQYGNSSSDSVTVNIVPPETLVSIKTVTSNKFNRAPVDLIAKATVTRGSQLDRLVGFEWKVNNEVVRGDIDVMKIRLTEPGTYEIRYTAYMRSGSVGEGRVTVTVNPNRPPECSLDYRVVSGYVVLAASCSDPDGRISSYKWDLDDGRGLRYGTTRMSFKATPGTRTVRVVATDDCGATGEATATVTVSE